MVQKTTTVKIAVFTIASSAALAAVGTTFGVLWLFSLWRIGSYSSVIFLHPEIQIFGFLTLFIAGVSFLLIPRFKNKSLKRTKLAVTSVSLVIAGNISWILGSRNLVFLGDVLLLLGVLMFAFITLETLGKPSGVLKEAEPFMILSVILLVVASLLKLYIQNQAVISPYWIAGFMNLALLGFPVSMIYGVMVRTIHFRVGVILRRRLVRLAFILHTAAIVLSIYRILSGDTSNLEASILFLIAGLTLCIAVDAFKRITHGELFARMIERDKVRYIYFSAVFVIAFTWLIAGLVFNVIYNTQILHGFGFRDAAIHSLTVGFIGNTIMAYAPILLPPLIKGKTPYRNLSPTPVYLINLGNVWRVLGILAEGFSGMNLWVTAFSGLLILVGMAYFLLMVHSLKE